MFALSSADRLNSISEIKLKIWAKRRLARRVRSQGSCLTSRLQIVESGRANWVPHRFCPRFFERSSLKELFSIQKEFARLLARSRHLLSENSPRVFWYPLARIRLYDTITRCNFMSKGEIVLLKWPIKSTGSPFCFDAIVVHPRFYRPIVRIIRMKIENAVPRNLSQDEDLKIQKTFESTRALFLDHFERLF